MSEVHTGGRASVAIRRGSGDSAALGAADWLSLAAAPAFAIMALLPRRTVARQTFSARPLMSGRR